MQRPEKIGKIDDVVFDSNTGQIRYVVIDTGGWLHSRRFLLPPEELKPSAERANDFTISLTQPQIEQFPALDEKVLEDNEKFAAYEKTYRSSWTELSATRKPVTNSLYELPARNSSESGSYLRPAGNEKSKLTDGARFMGS